MHIAFLTSEYPHKSIVQSAGIGTSIKNLASQLVLNGHLVSVFVYSQNISEVIKDNGIIIHKIAYKKYFFMSWFFYRKQLQHYINKVIKTERIDILEAPDWTGITAFMTFVCPLLIRLHGSDTYFCHLERRKQKLKNYFFEKIALKQANYITSVSKFTAKKTAELFGIKKPIKVIYNGIDTALFSPLKEPVLPNSVLYFGSIIRKKGVLELAEIFNLVVEKIPDATLTLLGKDVVDVVTKKSTFALFVNLLSEKAKNNTTHVTSVPYEEVKDYIAKATIIALPSFAEAFPMTWLETMAMEKSLVTSNIGWAKELMIDGKTGFMEDPKNHQLYANKIVKLIKDKEINSFCGRNARKHISEEFSLEIVGAKNINYYKSIIEK